MVLIALLSFVFLLYYYLYFWQYNRTVIGLEKFPGPSAVTLLKAALRDSGYTQIRSILNRWRETYGTRFRFYIGHQYKILVLTAPQDLELILTHPDMMDKGIFLKQYSKWFGNAILSAPAEKWRTLRKISSPFFAPRNLRCLSDSLEKAAEELCREMGEAAERNKEQGFDVRHFMIRFAYKAAIMTSCGETEDKFVDQFIYGAKEFSKTVSKRLLRPWYVYDSLWEWSRHGRYQNTVAALLTSTFKQIIENMDSKNAIIRSDEIDNNNLEIDPGKGAMTYLEFLRKKQAENSEHSAFLDDEEILRNVITMAAAASGSTGATLSWLMFTLGSRWDDQDTLYEEIQTELNDLNFPGNLYSILGRLKKLDAFIYETIRLYPTVDAFERTAKLDIKLSDGAVIPTGTMVIAFTGDAASNPEIFPNPQDFDMKRFYRNPENSRHPYAFLPFSGGPRNCIGSQLAMIEMKIVLVSLLIKYRITAVSTFQDIGTNYYLGVHPKNAIKIQLTDRR